jgi:MoxR-like ATPase
MTNNVERLQNVVSDTLDEAEKVIIGQEKVLKQVLIVILTGHHALVEGVPGVAKTLMVRTMAHILGSDFDRIQFTPDMMPSDITGTNVYNMQKGEFNLMKGPIFTTFLLADEINRAPAKTQAALLEAMQERQVSIDRETHHLSRNFTVFATQNPVEHEGTYALPEAQKDRFMMKIEMNALGENDELELARRMLGGESPEKTLEDGHVERVLTDDRLDDLRDMLQEITVKDDIVEYVVRIVRQTRNEETVLNGASPRATQALVLGSRAHAAIAGRDFVSPDDVQEMCLPILRHRIILRPEYEIEGMTEPEVVESILKEISVPR